MVSLGRRMVGKRNGPSLGAEAGPFLLPLLSSVSCCVMWFPGQLRQVGKMLSPLGRRMVGKMAPSLGQAGAVTTRGSRRKEAGFAFGCPLHSTRSSAATISNLAGCPSVADSTFG